MSDIFANIDRHGRKVEIHLPYREGYQITLRLESVVSMDNPPLTRSRILVYKHDNDVTDLFLPSFDYSRNNVTAELLYTVLQGIEALTNSNSK
jgi:hypothetical protein